MALPSMRVEKSFDVVEVKLSVAEANQLIWQRHCSKHIKRFLKGSFLATLVVVLVAWQGRHAWGARTPPLREGRALGHLERSIIRLKLRC